MMDMSYGQAGTTLHELRNPAIGKYVHQGMKYAGAYDQHTSGRDAYMATYSTGAQSGVEGWQWPKSKDGANDRSAALFHHPETGEACSGSSPPASRHRPTGCGSWARRPARRRSSSGAEAPRRRAPRGRGSYSPDSVATSERGPPRSRCSHR